MSDIKLSDQLGAMAIIDSLYAQQIAVEEHLNLPELRQKLAQRIREYYQSAGVEVNDALIEQGIKSWFTNRLRYQAPRLSLFQRALARLYLTSRVWLKVLFAALLIVILAVGYRLYASKSDLAGMKRDIAAALTEREQLNAKAQQLTAQLPAWKSAKLTYAAQPAADIVARAESGLADFNAHRLTPPPLSETAGKAQTQQRLSELQALNQAQYTRLEQAYQQANQLPPLVKADRALSAVVRDPNYAAYSRQDSRLSTLVSAATLALSQNAANAEAEVDKAVTAFAQGKVRAGMYTELERRAARLKALSLSAADAASVNEQIEHARAQTATVELTQNAPPPLWNDAIQTLDDLYNYIVTPLTFVVVDRVGEKSGVERTYDSSGGRSWYLIAEALTPQGTPFPVRIKDSETGAQKKVQVFGIRITQAEYEKLKSDKQDDGHIDNNLIGRKPANQLAIQYVRPVMEGRITVW